jgi:hypothetical protein
VRFKEGFYGAIATVLLLVAHTASALESGSIRGTVTGASGGPVAGAFVRPVSPQTRFTFLVISQDGGRYDDAKDLPVGTYVVQGIGPISNRMTDASRSIRRTRTGYSSAEPART